jgi:ABC-type nitrate/sulfonate/bicarbonate transport system permease component
MAETGRLTVPASAGRRSGPSQRQRVLWLRVVIVAGLIAVWEAVAASGLLFRDVVPSLVTVGRALVSILSVADYKASIFGAEVTIPEFYRHLWVTFGEVATAMAIGGLAGLSIGLALGANPFLSQAFERFLYYLGPTPKIIFFPLMIMWFGVGPGSKVAMGTISCFFPVVLSAAAGVRQIDSVLIRVGRSFRVNTWQMVTKIYLPAMRQPIVNGVRLGLGVAVIGTLLAETKLSNQGLGFLIINSYSTFDMPRMYALLILLFAVSIAANSLVSKASRN